MKQNTTTHSRYFGPLMMLMAALCFSGGGIAIKLIPWNPLAINGMRNFIAMFVVGAYMLFTHHRFRINKVTIFGAVCLVGVTSLFTMANKMTTAGNAIILQYAVPIWIIIMMFIFFRSIPSKLDVITIVVVLIGIGCFFYDSIAAGHVAGDIIAVLAGVFYAGVFIINQFDEGDVLSSTFLGEIISALLFAHMVRYETVFTPTVIASMLFLGAIQVGLAYIFFNIGTRYTHPVTASLIAAIEPVMNPVLVAVFWGEMLQPLSLLGGAIVIISIGIYNILKIKRSS